MIPFQLLSSSLATSFPLCCTLSAIVSCAVSLRMTPKFASKSVLNRGSAQVRKFEAEAHWQTEPTCSSRCSLPFSRMRVRSPKPTEKQTIRTDHKLRFLRIRILLINKNDGKSGSFCFTDYVNVEDHEQTCYTDIEGDLGNRAQENATAENDSSA